MHSRPPAGTGSTVATGQRDKYEDTGTDAGAVFRFLCDNRFRPDDIPDRPEPGVYAIFAESLDCIPAIVLPQSGLVYVGQSGDLAERNHFKAKHSGFSSPRRSFGALHKSALRLTAEPRSPGRSPTNYKNYRFGGDGEMRLSAWMRRSLICAIFAFAGDSRILEKRLIKKNEPPLNLTDWRNPQEAQIQALREFARKRRSVSGSATT